jgi:hypothetical protein
MSNSRDRANFLNKLREDLKHFDESDHLGDDPNVMEIKSILLRRIAELEAAIERTTALAAVPRTVSEFFGTNIKASSVGIAAEPHDAGSK